MDGFGYNRCERCDEANLFPDGVKCARCLSLCYVPTTDEDNEKESSIFSFDYPVAA
jgi:hypothetical protein